MMQNNSTAKNKKKSRNNSQKNNNSIPTGRRNPPAQATTLVIPRSVNCSVPDRMRTTLRFWKVVPINLSVSNTGGVRFQPSGPFDVDPLVGGSTPKGFAELASLYASYRVRSSFCKAEMVSPGLQTPVTLILLPMNADPGSSPTAATVTDAVEQPYAVSQTGSLRGGPMTQLTNTMTTEKIFGSPMVKYDDSFASLTSTTPVNNWFWFIAFYAPAVIPSSEGAVICYVYMEIEVDFYDRRFLF